MSVDVDELISALETGPVMFYDVVGEVQSRVGSREIKLVGPWVLAGSFWTKFALPRDVADQIVPEGGRMRMDMNKQPVVGVWRRKWAAGSGCVVVVRGVDGLLEHLDVVESGHEYVVMSRMDQWLVDQGWRFGGVCGR